MTCKPDLGPLWLTAGAAFTLLIAGCTDSPPGGSSHGDKQDDMVSMLIADAQYEISQGNFAEAGRLYDEGLAIDREDPRLWVAVARLRYRGGEHVQALEAAEYALTIDPQYAPALLMRAQLVRDANGLADSLVWFETALSYHPQDAELLGEYAATLGDLGRNQDMLAVVRVLAEADPGNPRIHYLQAVLAARAGDPLLASSLLKRSGLHSRGVPAAVVLDALIEMQQANYDSAVASLSDLSDRQPGNVRVQDLLGRALWLGGRDSELLDRFEDAATEGDATPYLTMLVGRALERLGQRDKAAPLIEAAFAAAPDGWDVLPAPQGNPANLPPQTMTMRQLAAAGNAFDMKRYAERMLAQFSGSADIAVLAGDAMLAGGDASAALELYSRAALVRRPWPLTKKIIAAYRALGDNDAADALLIRHLKGEPRNTEAMLMWAERAAEDKDWARVTLLLDHAISLGAGNDPVLLTLRLQAAKSLQDEEGAQEFDALLKLVQPDPLTGQ